ncbi:MAG TPA: PQQ-binding-like beta-propeller repeat protein [Ktedonobacteraceae bacterium]|jgi:outer membrane protein assembly factor BamB|nr:PQQ-binding-like beta-propeller repeat protein [Ktedonobacteraceae bacterium]
MLRLVLLVIAVLLGLLFAYVITRLPWWVAHQKRLSHKRNYWTIYWMIAVVFFLAFVSSDNALSTLLLHGSKSQSNDPPLRPLSSLHATSKNVEWTGYHNNSMHTGYVANEPDPHQLIQSWTKALGDAVYAEPLVIGGHVIVASEGDTIYSLDALTGEIQWQTNVGRPVPLSTLNCSGTINLIGITGTPVYDPGSGLVFAVAEVTGPMHVLVGIDVNTGKVRIRRRVDVPEMRPPGIYLQRPALSISHGMIYIAFGGLADDCGQYHGTLVASRTDGEGPLLSYQVPTHDSGGIWGTSGPVIDQDGRVFVTTGNEDHMTQDWDWDLSNAVLRLSPTLQLEDSFAPANWRMQDTGNQDLGSMGPALLPGGYVFAAGKSGDGYLLNANALGGIGGQVATMKICNGLALGGVATIGLQIIVPCSDGLRSVQVEPGPKLKIDWHALPQIALPPVVGGNTVYSLDQEGTLYALDLATGKVRIQLALGITVPHFVTPTISDGRLFVGTTLGIVSVALA